MYDRSWTLAFVTNRSEQIELALPDGAPVFELMAWQSAPQGGAAVNIGSVYICSGKLSQAEVDNRSAQDGLVDCLMCVPPSGIGCVRVGQSDQWLTVNSSASAATKSLITLRLRQVG